MNSGISKAKFRALGLTLLLVLTLPSITFGQAISGNLVGTVVDSSGAAVSNAEVTALKLDTGVATVTKTNATGGYRFENLPAGAYKVTAKQTGFRATTQQVDVVLSNTGTVNLTLTPGSASETVEVSGTLTTIDTTTAQLSSSYSDILASELGVASGGNTGAGVLDLSMLSPGVSNASALAAGSGPSVGGMRPRDNNFTVEGVDNNRKDITGPLISVPNDAVESFTLLENQFSPEFGHSSGGQFNTTVKSGTNSFHGSLYEYFGNRNLNALDNYYVLQGLTKNPPLDNNRYGGTFGGPIVKNKLFFFTNFERQRFVFESTSGGAVSTPTAAGLAAIATDPNLNATNFGIFKQYVPAAATSSGPSGCIPYNGTSSGFGGSFGNSFSAPANGACSAGNIETGSVSIVAPAYQKYENFVGSMDYNMSDHDQIRGRYIYNKEDEIDNTASLPVFYTTKPPRWHLLTISEYHTFTPALINEFRSSFNRFVNPTPAGNFKYAGLDQFPNIVLNDLGSGLQIGPDSQAPQTYAQNFYSFVDNLSWTRGSHSLKFGGEFGWYISPQTFTQRQRGDYEYNETQMFLEDFSPDYLGERSTGAITYYGNDKHIYWYAQDSWRLNRHLTLDYGIRYEYTTLPKGEGLQTLNQISNDPNIIVSAVNQPLLFNKPQVPTNNWAPRFGFAYSPGSSATTSIRGGIGMAYDILYDNIGILAVPPQVGSTADVTSLTSGFLAGGGLPGGGSGTTAYDLAEARAKTANWVPNKLKWPYAINWNFGIQHSFGKDYTAEVRYVGTHGVRLDQQDRIDKQAQVTPTDFLPTYLQAPSQAQLDALTTTLASIKGSRPQTVPAFSNDGFISPMTADLPIGFSIYHGLQSQLTRRFSNGLTFQAAYTYSRDIDSGTADFFSTYLTPRRPQDFQNWSAERGLSALSRTHRFTLAAVYDLPYFKQGNWFVRNIVGNWGFAPVYTYESPEYVTVNAGRDANLNGDSAGDRAIFNPKGTSGTGTDVMALTNTGGDTVAYCACGPGNNPNAQYIRTGPGALADVGRNTLATVPTNNLDFAVYKDLNLTERLRFHIGAQAGNILNHPQYIPGSNPGQGLGVNDVGGFNTNTQGYLSFVTPGNSHFNVPKSIFGSSSRQLALVAKFIF